MRTLQGMMFSCALFAIGSAAFADDVIGPSRGSGSNSQRWVIRMPASDHEDLLKVEVIVGRNGPMDCNATWFNGSLNQQTNRKWGVVYYEMGKITGPASTRIACPAGSQKDGFIRVKGNGFLFDYNSKMPIVIFAPQDFDVRYRVWHGDDSTTAAEKN